MAIAPLPPTTWTGSKPEFAIFWALNQLGYIEGVDFTYQQAIAGGRMDYGGAILDFVFHLLSIAINVQSIRYHYERMETRQHDEIIRVMVEGFGLKLIYIDEEDALRNPIYYAQEALAGRDWSRMIGL